MPEDRRINSIIEHLVDELSVVRISDEPRFRSTHLPLPAGSTFAYGGFSIGVAINAAAATVELDRCPYSVLGQFLRPVSPKINITCKVLFYRDTRSFSTRAVHIFQQEHLCMLALIDFRAAGAALFTYSPSPALQYSEVDDCNTTEQLLERLQKDGLVSSNDIHRYSKSLGQLERFVEVKHCPEGISGQNLSGLVKNKTSQYQLSPTERSSAEWIRCQCRNDQSTFGSIGFMMDAALSFLPLTHEQLFFDDRAVAACSTLDFALRIWETADLESWHLRERRVVNASSGLTYSEGRLWSPDRQKLVASMTQQCILRPRDNDTLTEKAPL